MWILVDSTVSFHFDVTRLIDIAGCLNREQGAICCATPPPSLLCRHVQHMPPGGAQRTSSTCLQLWSSPRLLRGWDTRPDLQMNFFRSKHQTDISFSAQSCNKYEKSFYNLLVVYQTTVYLFIKKYAMYTTLSRKCALSLYSLGFNKLVCMAIKFLK